MKLRTIESKFRNLLDTMHRALKIPNLRLGDKIVLTDFSWFVGKQPAEPRQRDVDSKIEDENTPTILRLEIANKVLRLLIGTALLISALVRSQSLSLYHMHIVYDTISLVMYVFNRIVGAR
jgi:hypothetical protein